EMPHDEAYTLLSDVWNYPLLEPELLQSLLASAVERAERDPNWFSGFEPSLEISNQILNDTRVSTGHQESLLRVLRQGLLDRRVRSTRRVQIMVFCESLLANPRSLPPVRRFLSRHLPKIRQRFLEDNLAELHQSAPHFVNHVEIGFLLTKPYLGESQRL